MIPPKHIKYSFKLDKYGLLNIDDRCRFSGIGFDEEHEIGECSIALQIIPFCNGVIELGGGWGKVSHMINKILSERDLQDRHLVFESSQEKVDDFLSKNKKLFGDRYSIANKSASHINIDDLSIFDPYPDCLYVDCEGCLYDFQKTKLGRDLLQNSIKFIVNEMDGNNKLIKNQWSRYGFRMIARGYGCVDKCLTEVWYKERNI